MTTVGKFNGRVLMMRIRDSVDGAILKELCTLRSNSGCSETSLSRPSLNRKSLSGPSWILKKRTIGSTERRCGWCCSYRECVKICLDL